MTPGSAHPFPSMHLSLISHMRCHNTFKIPKKGAQKSAILKPHQNSTHWNIQLGYQPLHHKRTTPALVGAAALPSQGRDLLSLTTPFNKSSFPVYIHASSLNSYTHRDKQPEKAQPVAKMPTINYLCVQYLSTYLQAPFLSLSPTIYCSMSLLNLINKPRLTTIMNIVNAINSNFPILEFVKICKILLN